MAPSLSFLLAFLIGATYAKKLLHGTFTDSTPPGGYLPEFFVVCNDYRFMNGTFPSIHYGRTSPLKCDSGYFANSHARVPVAICTDLHGAYGWVITRATPPEEFCIASGLPSGYSRDGLNITKVAHTASTGPQFRFQCKAKYYSYCKPGATCVADDGLLPYWKLPSGGYQFYNLPECRQLKASTCAGVTSYYSQKPSTHAGAQKACRRLNMRLATASFTRIQFTDEASKCLGHTLPNPIWIDKSYVAQFRKSPSDFWSVPLRHVQQNSVNGIVCLPDYYQYIVNRNVIKLGPDAIYKCPGGRKLYYIASDVGRTFAEASYACQERAYQLPAGIMIDCMRRFAETLGFSVSKGEGTSWTGAFHTPDTAFATSGYAYFLYVKQRLTICTPY
ncbi:uncharacterized protein LOC135811408 [Sycon ciliatum]|uniref:uncharacterized protein LOC135811408 n=1 Tax=Sycon ciliatum TaxID=27933 RepID=UPI0031F6A044